MATATPHFLLPFFFFFFILQSTHFLHVSSVGINYGTVANNLPPPKRVAQLLQSTIISKVKIYDTNPEILEACSNTGIDLIVAIENSQVANISSSPSAAEQWFTSRVAPFIPATSIVAIVVGNEYLTADNTEKLDQNALVQAMQRVHAVLLARGLDRKIKVTTPHSMAVLATSFPPSASTFAEMLLPTMTAIMGFLADTGAPFMVNAYPYFATTCWMLRSMPSTPPLLPWGSVIVPSRLLFRNLGGHPRVTKVIQQRHILIVQRE